MLMRFLTLDGPTFLIYYAVFSVTVLCFMYFGYYRAENKSLWNRLQISNPYFLAAIRNQHIAPIETAVAVLQRMGLVNIDQTGRLTISEDKNQLKPQHEIEKHVLTAIKDGCASIDQLLNNTSLTNMCQQLTNQLIKLNLHMNVSQKSRIRFISVIAGILIFGIGTAKMTFAWLHGHYNVGYSILICIVSLLFLIYFYFDKTLLPRKSVIKKCHKLILPLLNSKRKRSTNDVAFIAALFGISYLNDENTSLKDILRKYNHPKKSSSSWLNGSGCALDCSHGCSHSCGHGCGGCSH